MDSLTSNDEKVVMSQLLSAPLEVVYSRYDELLSYYRNKKFSNARITLQLACSTAGYKVELPTINLDNFVHFDLKSGSVNMQRAVSINALQICLLAKGTVPEVELIRSIFIHMIMSHGHSVPHGLNVQDYTNYPAMIRLIDRFNKEPEESYRKLVTMLLDEASSK